MIGGSSYVTLVQMLRSLAPINHVPLLPSEPHCHLLFPMAQQQQLVVVESPSIDA